MFEGLRENLGKLAEDFGSEAKKFIEEAREQLGLKEPELIRVPVPKNTDQQEQ